MDEFEKEWRKKLDTWGLIKVRNMLNRGEVKGPASIEIATDWIDSKEYEQNKKYKKVTKCAAVITAAAVVVTALVGIFALSLD